MANIKFKLINGYYDVFVENGSIAKTKGLDSQILMGLFNDTRADESEVQENERQRGWVGNIFVNNIPNYEIGCKLWIDIEQGKFDTGTINRILETIEEDGLKFLVDDGYATSVTANVTKIDYQKGSIDIQIIFNNDFSNVNNTIITLWKNTN